METILALIDGFGDDPVVTLAVLGVAGGALAAYVVFGFARDRQGLRRRAAAGTDVPEPARAPGKPERPRSLERLVSFIDENIAGDTRQNRVLRRQLIQAGFFDPRAGAVYFAARLGFALFFGIACFIFLPLLIAPKPALTTRDLVRRACHRRLFSADFICAGASRSGSSRTGMGFPDFMDLMVVCAEAGLSMEAAIERIARELVEGYPSLAENLYMVSLEIRAGKTFTDAFEHMGERLGIDEAMICRRCCSNRRSSARASQTRCGSTATKCAASACRGPRRRPTRCRRN